MSTLFAAAVPAGRQAALGEMVARVRRVLAVSWPGDRVIQWSTVDQQTAAVFLTIDRSPFGPPLIRAGSLTVVQAGYFLDEAPGADPATANVCATLTRGGWQALPTGDGVYAFAAWDAQTRRLTAGVDKLGMRPLYESVAPGGGVLLASEPKLLIAALDGVSPNWAAWDDLQRARCILGDHTPYAEIRRVGRAEIVEWDIRGPRRHVAERFLEDIPEHCRSVDEFMEENHAAFVRVMRRCLTLPGAAAPVLTMSGGLDSRRLLAGLLHLDVRPRLITVPAYRSDGTEVESGIVRLVASHLGLEASAVVNRRESDLVPVLSARDAAVDFETHEHVLYGAVACAARGIGQLNFDGLAGDTLMNPGKYLLPKYLGPDGQGQFLREMLELPAPLQLPEPREAFADRMTAIWDSCRNDRNALSIFALDQRGRRTLALGPMALQARAFESVCPFLDRDVMLTALALPTERRTSGLLQRPLTERLQIPGLADLTSTRDPAGTDMTAVTSRLTGWGRLADGRVRYDLLRAASINDVPGFPARNRRLVLAAGTAGERIGRERVRRAMSITAGLRRAREMAAVAQSAASHLAYLERACQPFRDGALALEPLV